MELIADGGPMEVQHCTDPAQVQPCAYNSAGGQRRWRTVAVAQFEAASDGIQPRQTSRPARAVLIWFLINDLGLQCESCPESTLHCHGFDAWDRQGSHDR
jgi:hypothetical protein